MLKNLAKNSMILLSKLGGVLRPFQIAVEITERCNLRCTNCPRENGVDNRDMTVTKFREIVEKCKPTKLSFVGRGETFCHPHIWDILDLCKDLKYTSITTNGTFLDTENCKRLSDYGNIELVISIDDTHAENFYRPMFHVKQFDVDVVIQSMYTNRRGDGMDTDWVLWNAENMGAKEVRFFYPIGLTENVTPLPKIYPNKKYPFQIIIPPRIPTRLKCYSPFYFMRIAIDGSVYPCCYIYNAPGSWYEQWDGYIQDVPQQNYVMGNIFEESMNDIWYGDKYRELRKKILSIETGEHLMFGELNTIRKSNDCAGFGYCDQCLQKWGMAC